jgi:hypothetical protein
LRKISKPLRMQVKKGYIRKDVELHPDIIERLQILADKKKWKLKLYMEETLNKESKKADK